MSDSQHFVDSNINISDKLRLITDDTIDKLLMVASTESFKSYSLVITGTIGSGKSTMCEILMTLINKILPDMSINVFPEFNCSPGTLGGTLLMNKLNGTLSSNTFQSFILDTWENNLRTSHQRSSHGSSFKLYERCIDDSILCFCNIDNQNGQLDDESFNALYHRAISLNEKYNVPSIMGRSEHHFTRILSGDINTNLNQILDIIQKDLSRNVNNRIIGLTVSDYESKTRVIRRNRNGEDAYTDTAIAMYNNVYNSLYDILDKHKTIKRIADMGKLL